MCAAFTMAIALALPSLARAEKPATFDSFVEPFLSNYCFDCHDDASKKGEVSLEGLTKKRTSNVQSVHCSGQAGYHTKFHMS